VIDGNGLPRMNQEQSEEGAGPAARERERATFTVERLDRTEDPKLQLLLLGSGMQGT
jgi:hypothetical protein